MTSFSILMVIALSFTRALSELCNPQDKQTLLQIKKELGNPTPLSSWHPTTDCCNHRWSGISCDTRTKTYRIHELHLINLNLPKPYPIPSSIGNLPYLNTLNFDTIPNLVGPIPPSFAKLTYLHYFYITHTNVSGQIPHFLSRIKTLVTIQFSHNQLSGTLPTSLSSLPNLAAVSFDRNRISGAIPDSYASFSGDSTVLSLSHNRLTGRIPPKLDIAVMDLSHNMLEGDASSVLSNNKNMQVMILAKNMLAFDFGKVVLPGKLETLDLRNNRIYGTLPKGLAALKHLKMFNVSYNNLCGQIPRGRNLQRFDASSYAHNKCLCGSPLPACT